MQIQRFCRMSLLRWKPHLYRSLSALNKDGLHKLCKYFTISQNKAEFICLKQPYVNKLNDETLGRLIETVRDLGFAKEVLIQDPLLFSIMPTTLKYRYKVLEECGFENITPKHLSSFLSLIKQNTIQLKKSGEIPHTLNVEQRLTTFLTQWPSLSTSTCEITLDSLRLKILQRYLESILDLTEEEFQRGLKTYPTIRHRPLQIINETLNILQSVVMIPIKKIKSNLYLIHVDPENLKQIIYKFRSIGGIDIKEVLRLHPKLATKRYDTMVEIRSILQGYSISEEAQRRCFAIYTLSPNTIKARLEEAKSIPEFETFSNHPRFLKMIYYRNTAIERLKNLQNHSKKCVSLNILSGSSAHYKTFENSPGDRLGKGKDLVFCITQSLGHFSSKKIWNMVKRHPFWCTVPLVQVKFVHQELSKLFKVEDIYENCPILLYPWNKIKKMLDFLEEHSTESFHDLDVTKLKESQKLSLILYFLEKNHYFTGNGVWTEEKNNKIIKEIAVYQDLNEKYANKMLQ